MTSGVYHTLRCFTEQVQSLIGKGRCEYDENVRPAGSLQASVEKIERDTGWKNETEFTDGVNRYLEWKKLYRM